MRGEIEVMSEILKALKLKVSLRHPLLSLISFLPAILLSTSGQRGK